MNRQTEPRTAPGPDDPELEATDGGWDPYVTSLLASGGAAAGGAGDEEDDGVPVMSFSRIEGKRSR
jgi:hypothetical protein